MASKLQKLNVKDEVVTEEVDEVFELLAGYIDDEGILQKTFTIREVNGNDEEAIYNSNKKANGASVITLLLERCVISIGNITRKSAGSTEAWRKVIQGLLVGDRDYIVLKLRELSVGDEFEVSHTCPNPECKAELTSFVNIDEISIEPFKGDYTIPFDLPKGYKDKSGNVHKEGILRLPNGLDGEILGPIAKKNIAKGTSMMLTRICTFADGTIITQDVMSSLTVRDRRYLSDILKDNVFGVDTTVDITCSDCGETFKATFNPANFI